MHEIRISCPRCGTQNRFFTEGTDQTEHKCTKCSFSLCNLQVVRGFVYVLSNELIPGLVKIGCTSRNVQSRIAELNSATGVPVPFRLEAFFASLDPFHDEAQIHRELDSCRVGKDREFFRCSVQAAVEAIQRMLCRDPTYGADGEQLPNVPLKTICLDDSAFRSLDELKKALRAYLDRDVRITCSLCLADMTASELIDHFHSVHQPNPFEKFGWWQHLREIENRDLSDDI